MKKVFLLLLLSLLAATINAKPTIDDAQLNLLKQWKAGQRVSQNSVDQFGIENCFVSCPVDEAIWGRIDGKSYKKECTIPLSELRYVKVLHYTIDGEIQIGEIICNKLIESDLVAIFRNLYNAKYPIERMILIDNYAADDNLSMDANNSSSFNFRFVAGTTRLSKHSMGLAIDINPLYNPYVKTIDHRVVVEPKGGVDYVDRDRNFDYKIDTNDLCYKEFVSRGFEWGGNWQTLKDYQHFEKSPQSK